MIDAAAAVAMAVTLLASALPEVPMARWSSGPSPGVATAAAADAAAVYRHEERAVSNWRAATRATLEPAPLAIAAALFASGRPVVTRCVKLNNPWCIKRARWTGELGGDEEGHTAFASTEAGADAAANLLRTYYVSLARRSALDIVRRWAPAECRIGLSSGLPLQLAVGGLNNTLRARFLAAQGNRRRTGTAQPRRGAAPAGGRGTVASRVPLAPMPTYRVPDLAPGLGERAAAPPPPPGRLAGASSRSPASSRAARADAARAGVPVRLASADGAIPAPSASSCGSEEGRIQYYGSAIARALGVAPGDDLQLFDAAGQPTDNLLPVMVAMSVIELGYLHAGAALAGGAVERLRARLVAAAAVAAAEKAAATAADGAEVSRPPPPR